MVASYSRYAAFRDAKGMKDIEVANNANISRSVMTNWKNGNCDLRTSTISSIAKILDCKIEDLLEEIGG